MSRADKATTLSIMGDIFSKTHRTCFLDGGMLGWRTAQPADRITPSRVFQCRTFTKSLKHHEYIIEKTTQLLHLAVLSIKVKTYKKHKYLRLGASDTHYDNKEDKDS